MLPLRHRLTKNGSFNYLYAHGNRQSAKKVKLNFIRSKAGIKVGFSVSNKVGKAVVRNLVKRRMRAIVSSVLSNIKPCQAVFVASVGIDELTFEELQSQMLICLRKAGLID